jgi:hypothetical protein
MYSLNEGGGGREGRKNLYKNVKIIQQQLEPSKPGRELPSWRQ